MQKNAPVFCLYIWNENLRSALGEMHPSGLGYYNDDVCYRGVRQTLPGVEWSVPLSPVLSVAVWGQRLVTSDLHSCCCPEVCRTCCLCGFTPPSSHISLTGDTRRVWVMGMLYWQPVQGVFFPLTQWLPPPSLVNMHTSIEFSFILSHFLLLI